MAYRVLIADDFEDMRELLEFVIVSELGLECDQVGSGNQAIQKMSSQAYDLIVTDLNMPDGTGADVYKAYQRLNLKCPFVLLSGDRPEGHPVFRNSTAHWLPKPFEMKDIINKIATILGASDFEPGAHVPVSIHLLHKLEQIEIPLFVKINDTKFVKLTSGPSLFKDEDLQKFLNKNVRHLYVESQYADELISAYRKKILSLAAWNDANPQDHELISLNTDLLKNLSSHFGWDNRTVDLAKKSVQKCLSLAKSHSGMNSVFQRFQNIERFGFSDHCTLTLLVSTGVLRNMGYADEMTLAILSFASVLHDMCLPDNLYDQKEKLLKQIEKGELNKKEIQVVLQHPAAAAELCKNWDFCPPGVDQIILNHHEKADGSGFPFARKGTEIDFLSAAFIVSEDFTRYFVKAFGKPDLKWYFSDRKSIYSKGHFKSVLKTLEMSTHLESEAG